MDKELQGALSQVSELLSSPEGSEKIGQMISSLFSEGDKKEDFPIDTASVMKIMEAYKSMQSGGDSSVTLLRAIKPYVREERADSVDKAIKLLTLLRLAPLMGDFKDLL